MPHAVMSLLADPQRLEQLRERGISAVRTQFAWEPYVERVDAALRQEPNDDPAAAARAVIGNALEDREHELIAALRAETANVAAAKARVESERDAVAGELDQARATIQAMQNTRVWRAAGAFWRTRDRLRRMIKS
jgi:hypothetical protein